MNVKWCILAAVLFLSATGFSQNPVCTKRGHIIPYYLDKEMPKVSKTVRDYADSTIVTETYAGVWYEEGTCTRCKEKILRPKNIPQVKKERLWMDSTKLMIDSTTGKVVRRSK